MPFCEKKGKGIGRWGLMGKQASRARTAGAKEGKKGLGICGKAASYLGLVCRHEEWGGQLM